MAGTFFHTAHPHTLTDMRLTLLTQIVIFWEKKCAVKRKKNVQWKEVCSEAKKNVQWKAKNVEWKRKTCSEKLNTCSEYIFIAHFFSLQSARAPVVEFRRPLGGGDPSDPNIRVLVPVFVLFLYPPMRSVKRTFGSFYWPPWEVRGCDESLIFST